MHAREQLDWLGIHLGLLPTSAPFCHLREPLSVNPRRDIPGDILLMRIRALPISVSGECPDTKFCPTGPVARVGSKNLKSQYGFLSRHSSDILTGGLLVLSMSIYRFVSINRYTMSIRIRIYICIRILFRSDSDLCGPEFRRPSRIAF